QALGIRDVQRENIAIEAVSPVETNFFVEDSENVFDGVYIKAVYTFDAGKRDEFFLTANGYFNHDGRVVVFPVEPNEVYTIKFHEPHDMFRLGIHDDEIEIPETVASEGSTNVDNKFYTKISVVDQASGDQYTFKNTDTGKFAVLYVSRSGEEPSLSIIKNLFLLKDKHLNVREITKQVTANLRDRTSVVVEDSRYGYAPRPLSQSVTWIGPNEPTEAEPYDEWRETEGFTYFTDFTEYAIGQSPNDWSERFTTSSEINKVIASRNYGGNVYWLRTKTNKAPYAQSFERVFGEHLDSEIYMKARLDRITSGQPLTVVHRGKMKGHGKEVYLIAGVLNIDDGYFRAALKNEHDDTASHLARIPLKDGFDPTEQYHQVSRVDGNRFRGKYWQVGEREPEEWDFDVLIPGSSQMEPGFIGIYSYINTSDYYIYEYGVGTGGMRAPRK